MTETYRFQANNGLWIEARPMREDDAPYLIDLFEHLSPQSRYQRFNQPLTNPDPTYVAKRAQELARVEPPSGGWLAFADLPGQSHAMVGGGRFVVVEAGVAEAALTVRDDLQGQGIGAGLLRILIEEARKVGLRKLVASAQASNRAVLNLVKGGHLPIRSVTRQGEMLIELDLQCCLTDN